MDTPDGKVRVLFYDYLGFEHNGVVLFVEPCMNEEDDSIYYLYIVDDNPEYNDKLYIAPDGTRYMYGEMRKSTECIRIS